MCYEYELEYYLRRAEELKKAQAAATAQAKKPAEAPRETKTTEKPKIKASELNTMRQRTRLST